jgi:prephenate dehydratase
MQRIAIQGKNGSFSHMCVNQLFTDFELVQCRWFDDLFTALAEGKAELAVCPVENSIAGTIIQTYDMLFAHPEIKIIGEYYLRVEHQ